ncbi:MAG: 2-C-methyl-D-erythritol 4-phosphate cytidylyltransferase [Nitrospinae bacterium]|nr:2-C-methyl-D-erythritol 4-phosphate cytidylyltransferase [Nitrospinota bacterium]
MTKGPKTAVIVPSAGSGIRMGGDVKKQFMSLRGRPVLAWTLSELCASPAIDEIIVVAPAGEIEFVKNEIIARHGISKVSAVVEGGATRQESVIRGFAAVSHDAQIIMTHDGVRPFVTGEIIERTVAMAAGRGAAVAAIFVKDTLKKTVGGVIAGAMEREGAVRIQTPQAFGREVFQKAVEAAARDGFTAPDESTLAERIGAAVWTVEGSEMNIKITSPEDIKMAEAFTAAMAG